MVVGAEIVGTVGITINTKEIGPSSFSLLSGTVSPFSGIPSLGVWFLPFGIPFSRPSAAVSTKPTTSKHRHAFLLLKIQWSPYP